ncbi:hypothetical protein EYR38_003577 [Pleurotus pulmonarius]|nr:hypothetical protein EYR38_003577 [Pleurotus pulmonarius]
MVWVSNRSSQTLKVTITNTTDGWGDTFEIAPEPLLVETWEQNHWRRKGAENATVVFEKSGLKFETALGPLDVLIVYNDTYIVQSSTKPTQEEMVIGRKVGRAAQVARTFHYQNVGHSTTKPQIHPESLLSDAQNIKFLQFVQLPELFRPEDERYLQIHTGEICRF